MHYTTDLGIIIFPLLYTSTNAYGFPFPTLWSWTLAHTLPKSVIPDGYLRATRGFPLCVVTAILLLWLG